MGVSSLATVSGEDRFWKYVIPLLLSAFEVGGSNLSLSLLSGSGACFISPYVVSAGGIHLSPSFAFHGATSLSAEFPERVLLVVDRSINAFHSCRSSKRGSSVLLLISSLGFIGTTGTGASPLLSDDSFGGSLALLPGTLSSVGGPRGSLSNVVVVGFIPTVDSDCRAFRRASNRCKTDIPLDAPGDENFGLSSFGARTTESCFSPSLGPAPRTGDGLGFRLGIDCTVSNVDDCTGGGFGFGDRDSDLSSLTSVLGNTVASLWDCNSSRRFGF